MFADLRRSVSGREQKENGGSSKGEKYFGYGNCPWVAGLRRPERSGGRRSPATQGHADAILNHEKKQLAKRLTGPFLQHLLQQFNDGQIDRAEAAHLLQLSQALLYRLRTRWLRDRSEFNAHLRWRPLAGLATCRQPVP